MPPSASTGLPESRSGHTALWAGDRMLVWGGVNAHPDYFADGGMYDPVGDVWESVTSSGAPRTQHAAVWTGSRMIVWSTDRFL